jgi:hypothetical protein
MKIRNAEDLKRRGYVYWNGHCPACPFPCPDMFKNDHGDWECPGCHLLLRQRMEMFKKVGGLRQFPTFTVLVEAGDSPVPEFPPDKKLKRVSGMIVPYEFVRKKHRIRKAS